MDVSHLRASALRRVQDLAMISDTASVDPSLETVDYLSLCAAASLCGCGWGEGEESRKKEDENGQLSPRMAPP